MRSGWLIKLSVWRVLPALVLTFGTSGVLAADFEYRSCPDDPLVICDPAWEFWADTTYRFPADRFHPELTVIVERNSTGALDIAKIIVEIEDWNYEIPGTDLGTLGEGGVDQAASLMADISSGRGNIPYITLRFFHDLAVNPEGRAQQSIVTQIGIEDMARHTVSSFPIW